MGLLPKRCGWNATQAIIDGMPIIPESPQYECLAQVRHESALEFLSSGLERKKNVDRPSLDSQETIRGLFYQIFVQRENGADKVQKWVQSILKRTKEASETKYTVNFR
jgi:hypothetical protein